VLKNAASASKLKGCKIKLLYFDAALVKNELTGIWHNLNLQK
jgi:hypothetical protein